MESMVLRLGEGADMFGRATIVHGNPGVFGLSPSFSGNSVVKHIFPLRDPYPH